MRRLFPTQGRIVVVMLWIVRFMWISVRKKYNKRFCSFTIKIRSQKDRTKMTF